MTNKIINKAQKGIKWTVIKTLFNSFVQPIYRILLALLLLPSEFAYIAVITLIVTFAEMLNNVGVGEAVIQKNNVTKKELSSLFFFNLFLTILIASILFLCSNLIANYYSMYELDKIVKLLLIVILINGSTNLFKFYLHKGFYFKETTILQIIKICSELFISIILIIVGYGIWGYVFGIIVSNIIHGILITFLVYLKTDFRLSFHFSFTNLSRFLNFGIFVGAKKILTYISHKIDEIIIGGVLSAEILGAYFLAKNILLQLQTLITISFGQVLLPFFSRHKNNLIFLKKYYTNIISTVIFISFPMFVGIILTAEYFVPIIFGEDWTLSIIVFQLLAIPIIFEVLSSGITSSLLYSQNKTLLVFLIDLFCAIGYIALLFVFNNSYLINIILIYSIYIILRYIISQYYVTKILSLKYNDYIDIFRESIIATIVMTIILIIFKFIFNSILPIFLLLIFSIILGIIIYITLNLLLNKDKTLNLFKTVIAIMKR